MTPYHLDATAIYCPSGEYSTSTIVSFSSFEIEKIKGSHSSKIKSILGYSSREEIVHKDDLVKL